MTSKNTLTAIRTQEHANCVVCSPANQHGLGLDFTLLEDGSVQAVFNCDKAFEGYTNVLHGGVISSLVDGAMTGCLFAHGQSAVTAELSVRFRHPVVTGAPAVVRAWVTRSAPPLHTLKAEVLQDTQVKVTASGKFMNQRVRSLEGEAGCPNDTIS